MKLKKMLGDGGVKGFFALHAEKLIFGVVILLVVFFVYTSATQEGISLSETPEKLKEQAQQARSHITTDHWDAMEQERVRKVGNYPARAKEIRTAIRDDQYAPDRPLLARDVTPSEKPRTDPELFAPIQVEVRGGVYSLAWRLDKPNDPFADDKDARLEPQEVAKAKRPRTERRPSRRSRSREGGYDMYGSEEGMGPGYGMDGSEEMMGPGYDEMTDDYGSSMVAGAGVRRVSSWFLEHYGNGFRPAMAGGAVRGLVVPRSVGLVSVTALVPYERQWNEYQRALAEAMGYNPAVDVPHYLWFEAERAEVTEDDEAPLEWRPVSSTRFTWEFLTRRYAGMPGEVADPNYVRSDSITMPIPPILQKPFQDLALHSEVPRFRVRRTTPTDSRRQELPPDVSPEEAEELAEAGLMMPPRVPGMGQMPSMMGPGGPGMSPMMGPGMSPMMGPGGPGMSPMMGAGGDGMSPGMGWEEYGMYGMGSGGEGYDMYGGASHGMGGFGASAAARRPVVQYLMVRFFDHDAKVGTSYRYRVRVVLEDPNRPFNPQAEPSRRTLDPDVITRVNQIEAEDLKYQQLVERTGTPPRAPYWTLPPWGERERPPRTFFVRTGWSEPSEVFRVEAPTGFVAGPVTPGRFLRLTTTPGPGPETMISEPTGNLVVTVWDWQRGAEVPAERIVRRGAYLNFRAKVDVMHPVTTQLKTIEGPDGEGYHLNTGGMVLDLRGGDHLFTEDDNGEKKTQTTPGEFLLVDARGNLILRHEIYDTEEYRRLMFIEDSGPTAGSMAYGMEGSGLDYMMEGSGFVVP